MGTQSPLNPDSTEPVFDSPAALRRHRCERLVLAYRLFGSLRWGEQGDGHITARDPERTDCFWLLRYGLPFDRATIDDLVLVDSDGQLVGSNRTINRTAHFIHAPVHAARPDIVCAVHTHTPYGTPWAACAQPFTMLCQEAVAFFRCHALFDDGEVDILSVEGGKRIAAALGDGRLAILRNHGLLTVGENVDQAVGWFLMAERVAEVHCKAPAPAPIDDEDAERCFSVVGRPEQGWKTFNWAIRARRL